MEAKNEVFFKDNVLESVHTHTSVMNLNVF